MGATKSEKLTTDLREAIRQCGMTQGELARKSGVSQPMISRFLAGKDIALTTAAKLAPYVGMRVSWASPGKK